VDFLTIAGHKLYAPKGVGALYMRRGLRLTPQLYGGGQERGLRPGTENTPHLVALGEACALAAEDLEAEMARQEELGRVLRRGLAELGVDYLIYSQDAPRLPATLNAGFKGLRAGDILSGLAGMDLAASAGAACHGDDTVISHVLSAMGAPDEYARGSIRFSWGRSTSREDMEELTRRLGMALRAL
jgi:cysteine desulfurase